MNKPQLYKRLSKYKVKKFIFDIPPFYKKEAENVLKQRGYVQHSEYWIKGFVKVYMIETQLMIQLDGYSTGVRCFYENSIFVQSLQYFENRLK